MRGLGIRGIIEVLFKHKWTILIVFLATAVTVTIGTFLMSPTYEADSQLLVKFGREYAYRPEIGTSSSNASGYRLDISGLMKAEIQILTSWDLAKRTVTEIGVQKMYPNLAPTTSGGSVVDDATQSFMDNLAVKGFEDSGVIEISFQHTDPQIAAQSVNVLVDLFKDKHLQTFTDPEASGFLAKKTDEFRKHLADSQEKLRQLKLQHTAYSLDEQRTLLLKQRSDLDAELKTTQNHIAEYGERLGSLKSQEAKVLSLGQNYTDNDRYRLVDETRSKLLELQLKDEQNKQKYTDDSPFIQDTKNEIGQVSAFLEKNEKEAREKSALSSPVYQDLSKDLVTTTADLKSQQGRIGILKNQIAMIDQELKDLTEPETQFRDLERQVATDEDNFKTISAKLMDAKLSEDMNKLKLTNIRTIQAAVVPELPIKPRKSLNILIGCFLGLVAGMGLALGSEFASARVSLPSQAQYRLGVPVLAVLPYNPKYLSRT